MWLWTKSFLQARTQQVKLPGVLSSTQICPAGVPQRSVISPLLFSIFIDDFDDFIPVEMERVRMCKYADDCTVYESVPSGCSSNMQKVLDGLQSWASTNNMLLNPKKTKDMWISFRKHSIEPETLRINNAQVERVSQFKLLGVWQQNNLRWNYHVEQTIKKACKRLHHLRECSKARLPIRRLALQSIVPKFAHSFNMRHKSGVVYHSIWQTTYSPYKTGVSI